MIARRAHHRCSTPTGQEQTPPGLYGPWGTIDNPGWHGDYTLDYNYEAIFYGMQSSNHPELMQSYYKPLLDYMPQAALEAANISESVLGHACGGLHYPDHLAPFGFGPTVGPSDGPHNSNGPYTIMPALWAWEYTRNVTELATSIYPLVKGQVDFFSCYLQKDPKTGTSLKNHRESLLQDGPA